MSDNWNVNNNEPLGGETEPAVQQPAEPVAQQPAEPAVQQPAEPAVQQPAEPAVQQPVTPPSPPAPQWNGDGSYRYVPPRPATRPETPPTYRPPTYQPPVYRSSNDGNAPYTPPPPNLAPKKNWGWVAVVSILAAVAIFCCAVMGVYIVGQMGDEPSVDNENSTPGVSTPVDEETSAVLGEDAPTLGITSWDNDDGGLSDKEIVKRNYASTVLLTAYAQTTSFAFGESNLVEAGASTGIVMTADGYIITNRHCVINESTGKPYERIDVTVYNDKTYEGATVIGADETTDLAVIHIDAKELTPANFGNSAELEVGDRVVALGNAAGLGWSASRGIVSALARDVYEDTGYAVKCLQVDASINPGNSGGPLLNNQGLVVGINSAKIAATDYEGIGFSIPIDEAKEIIDSLLKHGYVKGRVGLGITGQTISTSAYEGFMIISIDEKSALAGTNARERDLIVAVDGVEIKDFGSLRSELSKHKVGDQVELKLLRSDYRTGNVTSFTVTVTLQEQKVTVN